MLYITYCLVIMLLVSVRQLTINLRLYHRSYSTSSTTYV